MNEDDNAPASMPSILIKSPSEHSRKSSAHHNKANHQVTFNTSESLPSALSLPQCSIISNGECIEGPKVPKLKINIANLGLRINGHAPTSVISTSSCKSSNPSPKKTKEKSSIPRKRLFSSDSFSDDISVPKKQAQATKKKGKPVKKRFTKKRPPKSRSVSVSTNEDSPKKFVPPPFIKEEPITLPKRFRPDVPLSKLSKRTSPALRTKEIERSDDDWLCSLCHKGNNFSKLGDLFGPYYKEPSEAQKNEEGTFMLPQQLHLRVTPSPNVGKDKKVTPIPIKKSMRNHGKVKLNYNDFNKGILTSTPKSPTSDLHEIWVHEACATWTPGVLMQDNRVRGLSQAVIDAAGNVCSKCRLDGASLFCIARSCTEQYHFYCSMESKCLLKEDNFSVLCPKHKGKAR